MRKGDSHRPASLTPMACMPNNVDGSTPNNSDSDTLPVSNPDLVCSELFREPILVGVGRDRHLAGLPQLDLDALRNERILLLKEGHCFRADSISLCIGLRPEPGSVFETDQFASVFALIAAGFGIRFVPPMAAATAADCDFLPLT